MTLPGTGDVYLFFLLQSCKAIKTYLKYNDLYLWANQFAFNCPIPDVLMLIDSFSYGKCGLLYG